MNIPEEAARRYPHSGKIMDYQQDIFRDVFIAGAEWARAEAFREAAELIADAEHVRDRTATSVLRTLAEGTLERGNRCC